MRTYILYNYSTGMLTNWLRMSNFIFKFDMLTLLHLHLRLSSTVISKRQNLQFLAMWTNLRSWICLYIEFPMVYTRFFTNPFTVISKRQNLQFFAMWINLRSCFCLHIAFRIEDLKQNWMVSKRLVLFVIFYYLWTKMIFIWKLLIIEANDSDYI